MLVSRAGYSTLPNKCRHGTPYFQIKKKIVRKHTFYVAETVLQYRDMGTLLIFHKAVFLLFCFFIFFCFFLFKSMKMAGRGQILLA